MTPELAAAIAKAVAFIEADDKLQKSIRGKSTHSMISATDRAIEARDAITESDLALLREAAAHE
jgi:hypothetical protein